MRAVIFDLDGTLLNTLEDIRASINYARCAFDGEPIDASDTRRYVGNGLRRALTSSIIEHGPRLEGEEEEDLMFQLLMQYYRNHPSQYAFPYDGIMELLSALKTKGYKIAILSNKADDIVQKIVVNCFPSGLFDFIQGKIPEYPLKPDPVVVDRVLSALNVNKTDCLFIGDSEVDYNTAVNAGVKRIIVSYGFRDKEYLNSLGIETLDRTPQLEDIEASFEE